MGIASSILLFSAGLVLLIVSANWLVQASVKLSLLFKLTPLFIGAVLIAAGTSAPEAGVGVMAALRNQKGIALGNVLGSNIANIALILGLCAAFRPLEADKGILKREVPFLFLSVALFYLLSLDLMLSRLDGVILILAFIVFCIVSYLGARRAFNPEENKGFAMNSFFKQLTVYPPLLLIMFLSLGGVVYGADLMVRSGVNLAKLFGLTPWMVGLTVFAVGTSLPELAASFSAAAKNVSSLSVGNIVGSNIFNILFILGVVVLIRPISLDASILKFEGAVLAFFTLLLFIFLRSRYRISRREGILMFFGYLAFLAALVVVRV